MVVSLCRNEWTSALNPIKPSENYIPFYSQTECVYFTTCPLSHHKLIIQLNPAKKREEKVTHLNTSVSHYKVMRPMSCNL